MFQDSDNCQFGFDDDQVVQGFIDDYEITNMLAEGYHTPLLSGVFVADSAADETFDANARFSSSSQNGIQQFNVSQCTSETSDLDTVGFTYEYLEADMAP